MQSTSLRSLLLVMNKYVSQGKLPSYWLHSAPLPVLSAPNRDLTLTHRIVDSIGLLPLLAATAIVKSVAGGDESPPYKAPKLSKVTLFLRARLSVVGLNLPKKALDPGPGPPPSARLL